MVILPSSYLPIMLRLVSWAVMF